MKRTIHINDALSAGSMPAGLEVMAPHRRAADALGAARRTIEDEAWRRLYSEGLRQADASERQRHLSKAVSAVIEVGDPAAVAGWLRPSVDALLRAGIDPSILFDDDSERVRSLAKVTAGYLEILAGEKLVDPAEALWRAAGLGIGKRAILFWGYFRPLIDELEFIDALAGDGSRFILPAGDDPIFKGNREAAEFLESRGWEIDRTMNPSQTYGESVAAGFLKGGVTDAKAYSYPNIEAETRGVLAQVKKLLVDGVPSNEIVIAARDERLYGPVLEAIGWEYGVPVNLLYKIPISETRFGGWLKLLLEAVAGGFEFEPVARLMKHSLGPGLPDDAWKKSRRSHTVGYEEWVDLGVDLAPIRWPERASRKEYSDLLFGALDHYRVRSKSAVWARELKAFNLFRSTGEALRLEEPDEAVSIEEFAAVVRELLGSLSVEYQPGNCGVDVHAPRTLFGSSYRHVFVVGMAEGIVPAPLVEDALLDFHERKRLKGIRLDSAADIARIEELSFYLMLCAATERIMFSYPMLIGRETMLPSPWLTRMGIEPERAGGSVIAGPEEARRVFLGSDETPFDDEIRTFALHSLKVEEHREGPGPYDEYDGMTGRPLNADDRVWSATQLTAIGQCPFKWFAQKVLGIVEPEEMETELTPALQGQLYHKTLEIASKEIGDEGDPRAVVLDRLVTAFETAEKEVAIPHLPAWYARRKEHIETLRQAILSPEFIADSARAIGTETKFDGRWFGLKVNGVIDRIDRTPEGIVMIDYKSGTKPPPGVKNEVGRAEIDIQLPIYIRAAGGQLYTEDIVTGVYYSLRKAKILKTTGDGDEAELAEFVRDVRGRLQRGSYPVNPDNEWKACGYCDYEAVCRYGTRLNRKPGE
ncbi:MAG: PD-(D/E)XK nuclease family protein [Acidobacteriota bacterium]|nr:MAG: PD-(D/E)XK nuclease family protein [Acidobacteriota bacterium]